MLLGVWGFVASGSEHYHQRFIFLLLQVQRPAPRHHPPPPLHLVYLRRALQLVLPEVLALHVAPALHGQARPDSQQQYPKPLTTKP